MRRGAHGAHDAVMITKRPTSTNEIVHAVRELAPHIASRADEIEQGRRLPPDLVDALADAGCFRMLVPRSHGGAALDLTEQMHVIAELAQADGSVGWTTMIGGAAPVILGLLPRATFDAVYANGPDVIFGGAFNPTGVATPVDGGFRVTGQWAFASGCQHCHWFVAHCFVDDGRMPPVRMMVLPPSDVEIKDTWSVAGLCGTGSHDFVVNDVFVPDRMELLRSSRTSHVSTARWHSCPSCRSQRSRWRTSPSRSRAERSMRSSRSRRTRSADARRRNVGDEPAVPTSLSVRRTRGCVLPARSCTPTPKTRGRLRTSASPFTVQQRARIRATTTWAVGMAASVVDFAYAAGGGTSIYSSSPLQRRLRDIRALQQHFLVKPDTFTKVGAVLAGQEVDVTML